MSDHDEHEPDEHRGLVEELRHDVAEIRHEVEELKEKVGEAVEHVPLPVRWTVRKLVLVTMLALVALMVLAVVSVGLYYANRTELVAREDRKSTRLNSSHPRLSRMPSSA